mmetsp:Transcript_144902/g.449832  ORF Transcript_144902/g.449832 Transcript_144902/m.449832 type:complete len:227 (+) Transcript_144902:305-985(+)
MPGIFRQVMEDASADPLRWHGARHQVLLQKLQCGRESPVQALWERPRHVTKADFDVEGREQRRRPTVREAVPGLPLRPKLAKCHHVGPSRVSSSTVHELRKCCRIVVQHLTGLRIKNPVASRRVRDSWNDIEKYMGCLHLETVPTWLNFSLAPAAFKMVRVLPLREQRQHSLPKLLKSFRYRAVRVAHGNDINIAQVSPEIHGGNIQSCSSHPRSLRKYLGIAGQF